MPIYVYIRLHSCDFQTHRHIFVGFVAIMLSYILRWVTTRAVKGATWGGMHPGRVVK